MPRKKKAAPEAAQDQTSAAATAVAEPNSKAVLEPMRRPDYIDGPPVTEDGKVITPTDPETKDWGNPYKAIITTSAFEMGENRRFKQRVFLFHDKPEPHVLAMLKENGFTYRSSEKAWTIPANAATRVLTDRLAREFAGQGEGRG